MGKYTLYGTPQFEEHLEKDLQQIVKAVCALPDAPKIEGIVLLGGYGRGEGTPFQDEGVQKPFNDYDLLVISEPLSWGRRQDFQERLHKLERQLSESLDLPVDLYLHTTETLKYAEPSLMNYEMRYGHQVLYGEENILSLMPVQCMEYPRLDEGTRLLLNRGKLLLDVKMGLGGEIPLERQQVQKFQKFLWKNHLAFGDCILLAHGDYDISYKTKLNRITAYRNYTDIPDASWMVDHYVKAIEFKFKGNVELLEVDDLFRTYSETVRYYLGFLLWYEGRRLGTALPSLQTYCNMLPRHQEALSQQCKNFLRNARLLQLGMFSPTWRWSTLHPRNRLYPALWLLLSFESSIALDLGLIQQLLYGERDYNKLIKQFYYLRARLA